MNRGVYLAGPITGESWGGANAWREYAREILEERGVRVLSPLRNKGYLANETSIQMSYDHVMSSEKAIVMRDLYDVQTCDALLVNFLGATEKSTGTIAEIGAASILHKPIVVVMEEDNVHQHPFVRVPSIVVNDLDLGIWLVGSIVR